MRGLSVKAALELPASELRLQETINSGIWSDEVEMLAKLLAILREVVYGKARKWEELLPQRFLPSATYTEVPSAAEQKQIARSLSSYLDSLAKSMK